jgi:hypothetical protein
MSRKNIGNRFGILVWGGELIKNDSLFTGQAFLLSKKKSKKD